MPDSRTKNTKRNIVFSYLNTIVTFVFRFASRAIIVRVLGEKYLGLSSLFTSILGILSLAELGFSSAIVYNMYKPLAENDLQTVCALLQYYKIIYRRIAVFMFVIGIVILPFLPFLIKGSWPDDINIYLLYFLYLINTSVSYALFAYKASLLEALQRMDLTKKVYTIVDAFQYLMQIVSLLMFKNYYLFVVWMVIGNVLKNLTVAYLAITKYPQFNCSGTLSIETKKNILTRVKGLVICSISGVTYNTLDSMVLSTFIGLTSVAIYNNYLTVSNGVASFVLLIRQAMQASIGNSIATETKDKNYNDLLQWQFLFSVIATFCVTCLLSLYQPFMDLWMGKKLLLPITDVVLICAWFFLTVTQHSFFLYLSGNGMWLELRWPYICSTVCNLLLNIILGKKLGTTGVILASVIANLVFGLLWQCSIIFKKYFVRSANEFWQRQVLFSLIGGIIAAGAFWVNSKIEIEGIPGLMLKLLISVVVAITAQIIVYYRTSDFQRAKLLVSRILSR